MACRLLEPVPRPAGRRPDTQLGRQPPHRRPERRRCRRRGAVPEHRAAVLPHRLGDRARTLTRGVSGAPRRTSRAQPLARRLLRRSTAAARRSDADLPQRRRRRDRRDRVGPRARLAGRAPSRRVARHPVDRATVLAEVRPDLARVRRARHPGDAPRGWYRHPEAAEARVLGADVRDGSRLLGEPRAVAPHVLRRVRTLPRAAVRAHRAGHQLGAGRTRHHGSLQFGDAAQRSHRRARHRPVDHPADATERLLPAQRVHRCRVPVTERRARDAQARHRSHHVGQRLPARRGELAALEGIAAAHVRRVDARGVATGAGGHGRRGVRLRSRCAAAARRRVRSDGRRARDPLDAIPDNQSPAFSRP